MTYAPDPHQYNSMFQFDSKQCLITTLKRLFKYRFIQVRNFRTKHAYYIDYMSRDT